MITTVNMINTDPCKVDGLCSAVEDVNVFRIIGGLINSTDLVVTLDSYSPGSLRFTTTFLENSVGIPDTPFMMHTNRGQTNRGKLGACTSAVVGTARSWNCEVYIPPSDTITLYVAAPNFFDLSKPITKTLDISAPGGDEFWLNRLNRIE